MKQSRPYTVAVTGVGALIGQGIIKALRRSVYTLRIVGVDRNSDSVGTYSSDVVYGKPQVNEADDAYRNFWRTLVERENVDLILPGIEIDVFFLHRHRDLFSGTGAVACLNTPTLIDLAADKWHLGRALAGTGLTPIPTLINGDWEQCVSLLGEPPLLLKPRRGNGSRGIVRLENAEDLLYWKRKNGDNYMVQTIVGNDEEEYTVGSFGFGDGTAMDPIIMRRRLSAAGNTQFAQVVTDDDLAGVTALLNQRFCPSGPTNYQFRKNKKEIYLLEINPRFSSTASLRAAFGYNEAAMAIEYYLEQSKPSAVQILPGCGSRFTEDFIRYDRDNS